MSLDLHVFLRTADLPSISEWQAAINTLSLPVQLGPVLDLGSAGGFQPCRVNNAEAGFELSVDDVPKLLLAYPAIESRVTGARRAMTFRWGRDLNECACVMAAAAGLAALTGAPVYYPPDDLWYDVPELCAEFVAALRG